MGVVVNDSFPAKVNPIEKTKNVGKYDEKDDESHVEHTKVHSDFSEKNDTNPRPIKSKELGKKCSTSQTSRKLLYRIIN